MKSKTLTLLIVFAMCCIQGIQAQKRTNNITIIISLDGFRWDYPQMYRCPNIDKIGKDGVEAEVTPCYPASTYPNHYSIATGLYPDHHGIVSNTFYCKDNRMFYKMSDLYKPKALLQYGGEPIWITANRQGVKSGTIYWIGSEFQIKGFFPTYFERWSKTPHLSFQKRADKVLELLTMPEGTRPQLIMCYFEEPDHTGHLYGPQCRDIGTQIAELDNIIGDLWKKIKTLPIGDRVNLIVTSDHGTAAISDHTCILIKKYLKKKWYNEIAVAIPTNIYTKPEYRDTVYEELKKIEHVQVWKKEEVPEHLHYGTHPNCGDIIVAPDKGYNCVNYLPHLYGEHGYDPTERDMHVIFKACGPDFKKGYKQPDFYNVDRYPLLCNLLGIKPAKNDGDIKRVKGMLKN